MVNKLKEELTHNEGKEMKLRAKVHLRFKYIHIIIFS